MSEWISVKNRLPELKDDSVLAYFGAPDYSGYCSYGIDMVHIEEYFKDIQDGLDQDGNQLYSKWYVSAGLTHWQPLPEPPKA